MDKVFIILEKLNFSEKTRKVLLRQAVIKKIDSKFKIEAGLQFVNKRKDLERALHLSDAQIDAISDFVVFLSFKGASDLEIEKATSLFTFLILN